MKKLAYILPAALFVAACEGGTGTTGNADILSDDQANYLADVYIAEDITDNCPRYKTTISLEQAETEVYDELLAEGYTADNADKVINEFYDTELDIFIADTYDELNITTNTMSYCTFGDRARAAIPEFNDLLVPVNPSK